MSAFIIINEWTAIDNSTSSEPVDYVYYESEDTAHAALSEIAAAHGVHLDADEFSFSMEEPTNHIQFEEYYVQELSKRGSN